jgi:hypothetical protein
LRVLISPQMFVSILIGSCSKPHKLFCSFFISKIKKRQECFLLDCQVLALADFGCRWLSQLWRVTEPAAGYREPLWS